MTRRPFLAAVALAAVAALSVAGLVLARQRAGRPAEAAEPLRPELVLFVVESDGGTLGAVVGSTRAGAGGALVIPGELSVTIPGQGDGTVEEALGLPPGQAATAIANLLGVWVDHHLTIGERRLAAVVDRAGGIDAGGATQGGAEVLAALEASGRTRVTAFGLVLQGLLDETVEWLPEDLADSDSAAAVLEALEGARGASVAALPSEEAGPGIYRVEPEAVRSAIVEAFGGPDREVVPVIVLNGSGSPGIGEIVAERIVPGGFRIVVNENASSFDHEETLVVVGSADDVALGERVRDLLGTGSVSVSVSSGIAPVTIVVGKDVSG